MCLPSMQMTLIAKKNKKKQTNKNTALIYDTVTVKMITSSQS